MGTVMEPASEFFSGRLTKKERRTTLADELLSDQTLKTYRSGTSKTLAQVMVMQCYSIYSLFEQFVVNLLNFLYL